MQSSFFLTKTAALENSENRWFNQVNQTVYINYPRPSWSFETAVPQQTITSSSPLHSLSTPRFSPREPGSPLVMDYPPYLREQRPSQCVLYVPPCVTWRGNVSSTCVRILADPNLLGINQNTCLECALCQQLACRPDGLLLSEPFVSPLESSVLCQINSICPRDWFQNANAARGAT